MSGIHTSRARQEYAALPDASTRVPLTVIAPESPPRGGIVFLHEMREFHEPLLQLMHELADDGWLLAAPHLFHRQPEDRMDPVFGAELFNDAEAARGWLIDQEIEADSVGVIGFDSAGTAAAIVATQQPYGAAISIAPHGIERALGPGATPLLETVASLRTPWLGIFGEDDPQTPPDAVNALRNAALRAPVATLLVSYPGLAHRPDDGFGAWSWHDVDDVPDAEPTDTETAVTAAKQHMFEWLDSYLR
ncbi:dienelactone hydrolase family protein [Lolliginicoccus suaedae]|uniref:dienelactone hydrolase family protein n=1 Tax=Lolliginicoccus suaedae TaxID=2605429 RepID=UPI001F2F51DF|nr:dienelactone hydrolase family protein [Lolliginicoccus suaedae]